MEPGAASRSYWRPQTIGGALYLMVLGACVVALAVGVLGDWRVGVRIFAGVLCVAAGMRLSLPDDQAGMLAVRHRLVDVALLAAVGVVLFLLATSIPDQPV